MSAAGRLFGALKSGKRAAYFGIFMIGTAPFLRWYDRKTGRKKTPPPTEVPPCVLLVSPPRSGSTVIYQVLTRLIPSVYLSNLHFVMPFSASRRLLKRSLFGTARGYNNYYGYTSGWNGINEGNDAVSALLDGTDNLEEIRQRFLAFCHHMEASPERPLIFKNVRNYYQVSLLCKAVPELKILRIKRELEQVIQSELKAHYELKSYHPIPAGMEDLVGKIHPAEFVTRQIIAVEAKLDEQRELSPQEWIEVTYADFCSDPKGFSRKLLAALGLDTLELRNVEPNLSPSYSKKVSEEDEARIKKFMEQYA